MKTTQTYTTQGCRVYESGMPMMIVGSASEARAIASRLNEREARA